MAVGVVDIDAPEARARVAPALRRFGLRSLPSILLDAPEPGPVARAMHEPRWDGTLPATFVFDRAGPAPGRPEVQHHRPAAPELAGQPTGVRSGAGRRGSRAGLRAQGAGPGREHEEGGRQEQRAQRRGHAPEDSRSPPRAIRPRLDAARARS
ncbi:MAG: hypothetical protein NVS2B9_19130 [Myxococcales bacterium]